MYFEFEDIIINNKKIPNKLYKKYLILDFKILENLNDILKEKYKEIYTAIPKNNGKTVWKNISFKYIK